MDYYDKPYTVDEKIDMLNSGKIQLTISTRSFKGADIVQRAQPFLDLNNVYDRTNLGWPNKMTTSPPGPTTTGFDLISHKLISGVNFATQDYMSLCHHPGSVAASVDAIRKFGTHSGGSPLFFGKNPYYMKVLDSLRNAFKRVYPEPHPSIFSTGWQAGYGVLAALTSKHDHIIMDQLCHNCLQQGARASQCKVHMIEHLNIDAMCDKITELREKFPKAGIVTVTEGLFSMDSDCVDLDRLQKHTKKHKSVLVVDCAHDMFCLGSKGLGNPGERIKDFDNVVLLGSGSKSLSNNFGWCVSSKESLPAFMNYFAGSLTFSNALTPPVAASVSHNIDLLMSKEGDVRRERSMRNILYIRKRLTDAGFNVYGDPSPVVIVLIGPELVSRGIANMMYEEGVILNSVEFPACAPGDSRLRLQIQCDHTIEHLDKLVDGLQRVMPKVEEYLSNDKLAVRVSEKIIESITAPSHQKL